MYVKSTEIALSWTPPVDPFSVTELYEVRYFQKNYENASTVKTDKEQLVLNNLKQDTEYGFQIRAKTTHGWGEYSKPMFRMTGQLVGSTGEIFSRLSRDELPFYYPWGNKLLNVKFRVSVCR